MANRDEQNQIIKDICKEFDCTQIELAKKVGVTQGAIKKWSDGTREIPNYFFKSVELLRKIRQLDN